MNRWPHWRDVLLFFGGLGGVGHETLLAKHERPTLLIMFAAMMGLPAFLQPRQPPVPQPQPPSSPQEEG